jgi:hypothetical protein
MLLIILGLFWVAILVPVVVRRFQWRRESPSRYAVG